MLKPYFHEQDFEEARKLGWTNFSAIYRQPSWCHNPQALELFGCWKLTVGKVKNPDSCNHCWLSKSYVNIYLCKDCGMDTHLWEYYGVADKIWQEAIKKPPAISSESMLCIGCLEDRLGRRVVRTDFIHGVMSINDPGNFPQSPRLRSRLTSG